MAAGSLSPIDKASRRGGVARPEVAKTYCEFFAGVGLVDLGLRTSGWDCVYANDVDRRKRSIHATLFGPCSHYHLGDVGETDEVLDRIPGSPFLATASFPCVDLSVAGHYRGFDGAESSTFFAFAEVLRRLGERRPPLVMLENVVGFLSARGGADFEAALLALTMLGYRLDAFVVDAAHFVPQSRPRVFVVGLAPHLRPEIAGEPGPSVLRPLSLLRFREIPQLRAAWTTLPVTPPGPRSVALEDVIDLDDAQPWWDESQVRRHHGMMSDLHRRRVDQLIDGGLSFVGTVFRRIRQGAQRAEVRFDGLAGCLRTPRGGSGRQIVIAIDAGRLRMRWMTPREYARLQGAPDVPLSGPVNPLLFAFGDAVCVPVIRWLDEQVLTPLYERGRCSGESAWRTT